MLTIQSKYPLRNKTLSRLEMIYNPVPFLRGPIWWTLLYNAGESKVVHESVTPYLALAG